jgi:hypothetical protein
VPLPAYVAFQWRYIDVLLLTDFAHSCAQYISIFPDILSLARFRPPTATARSATTKLNYRIKVASMKFVCFFGFRFIPRSIAFHWNPAHPPTSPQAEEEEETKRVRDRHTYCHRILKFNFFQRDFSVNLKLDDADQTELLVHSSI